MKFENLSPRENQVINLIIYKAPTTKEMAEKLIVSSHTIKAHLVNIFRKLNIHNKYELLLLVIQDLERQLSSNQQQTERN